MRPLLEVQQTQKAAAGNNWRDLLSPAVSDGQINSEVHLHLHIPQPDVTRAHRAVKRRELQIPAQTPS